MQLTSPVFAASTFAAPVVPGQYFNPPLTRCVHTVYVGCSIFICID